MTIPKLSPKHRRKDLFLAPLLIELVQAGQTEGFEKERRGPPELLAIGSQVRYPGNQLTMAQGLHRPGALEGPDGIEIA